MKLLRNSKIILVVLVPALTLGIGAGFSNFFFGNTASTTSSVDPSIENIRDNFHFDEIEDTNLFNTKFYDVTFYAQAPSEGSNFYSLTVNGVDGNYHTELGYFSLNRSQIYDIQGAGGSLYQIDDDGNSISVTDLEQPGGVETDLNGNAIINHITFENISTITPEIASYLVDPVCNLYDSSSNTEDANNHDMIWHLSFQAWTTQNLSDDMYKGLTTKTGFETEGFQCTGYFPNSLNIPNFNLLLSNFAADENSDSISFYPLYTTGKDYLYSNPIDSISLEWAEGDSTNKEFFIPDSLSTRIAEKCINKEKQNNEYGLVSTIGYRLAGIEISQETDFRISNDIFRNGDENGNNSKWGGRSIVVPSSGDVTQNFYGYDDYSETPTDPTFKLEEPGRYNVYLFAKQTCCDPDTVERGPFGWIRDYGDFGYEDGWDPVDTRVSGIELTDYNSALQPGMKSETSQISEALKEEKVECYKELSLGGTRIYTCVRYNYLFSSYSYKRACDYRDYYLVVEKMYSPKLLGGPNGWSYESVSSSDPIFLQDPSDNNMYETRNVSLSANVTHTYQLGNYTLTLPGTCFSIGLSSSETKVKLPAVQYDESGTPTTVGDTSFDETEIDEFGSITYRGNLPAVVIKDKTTGGYRVDYYFSKNLTNVSEGLLTLSEIVASYSENPILGQITVDTENGSLSLKEALELSNSEAENISSLLKNTNIIVAPHAGQYNLYLQYEFENVGSEPVVDVYAYRIKNLTVQIFDPGDKNADGTIDGRDLVYRADGFVLTQNGSYQAYKKEYGSSNGTSSGESKYYLWTLVGEGDTSNKGEPITVDYISTATDFVSGDPLEAETAFSKGDGTSHTLSWVMNELWKDHKALIDITSGEYVTPYVVKNSGFSVVKNTILLAVYPPENLAAYGDLFTGYGESTSQEASL